MDTLTTDESTEGSSWSLFGVGDVYLQPGDRAPGRLLCPSLRERATGSDLAVANVEAPVRFDGADPIPKTGPIHESETTAPDRLDASGFDLVTVANNHTMDYGWPSLKQTASAYRDAGIRVTGLGSDRDAALEASYQSVGDVEVGVLGVCGHEFGVADEDTPGTAWAGHPQTRRAVRQTSREADVTVVLAHGGLSRGPVPSPMRRDRLREFSTDGADLVLGHHSHAPQGWEQYDDGLIFHCLGDLVFDSHPEDDPTSWGLATDVTFAGTTPVSVDLVPTEVVDGIVYPLGEEREPERELPEYHDFLRQVSAVTRNELNPHWQEIAVRKWNQKYEDRLIAGAGALPLDSDSDGRADTPGSGGPTAPPDSDLLTLLNNVRYGSHRAVVTTALAVLSGVEVDRRDAAVSETVDELQAWTGP